MKKGIHKNQRGRPHEIVVDQFETKCEERTSQEKQRGRPLDFFLDQLLMNHKERTAQENQRERPLDIVVDQFETKCEERISQENQKKGRMKLLSTSLKPSVKKGLRKKIKRGLLISFSTSCK